MNRRNAIKQTALILGYAVSASAASAVISGCEVDQTPSWIPGFLTPDQATLVAEISERILPKTTTPGAKDVMVDRFIDVLLGGYMKKPAVTQFMAGLADINARSQSAHQKSFVDLEDTQMDEILTGLADEAEEFIESNPASQVKPFFAAIKEFTLLGYFSSETISKDVLKWDPIPGKFDNCIPLEQNGGVNWAI